MRVSGSGSGRRRRCRRRRGGRSDDREERIFSFSFLFPLGETERREGGDRGVAVKQLAEGLVFAEGREREGELVFGGVGGEGQARVVRVGALVGGNLTAERSKVRLVLRLGEQTPDDACFEGGRACEFVDEHT